MKILIIKVISKQALHKTSDAISSFFEIVTHVKYNFVNVSSFYNKIILTNIQSIRYGQLVDNDVVA